MSTQASVIRTVNAETLRAPRDAEAVSRVCLYEDLGMTEYGAAWERQHQAVAARKERLIPDQLLLVEHPHVITLGRRAKAEHMLLTPEALAARGIALCATNRGGDVTYHGPGQVVAYPIIDLRDWKKDVVAYVRALERVIIDALADFGIVGERWAGCTGVWVAGAKVAAIGVHVSRWITSHGFALNVSTDLQYFECIIPCGLRKPVTSMRQLLGEDPPRREVAAALVRHFGLAFGFEMSSATSLLRNG